MKPYQYIITRVLGEGEDAKAIIHDSGERLGFSEEKVRFSLIAEMGPSYDETVEVYVRPF